jgi:hypothetical protein
MALELAGLAPLLMTPEELAVVAELATLPPAPPEFADLAPPHAPDRATAEQVTHTIHRIRTRVIGRGYERRRGRIKRSRSTG